ncbi:MAG TPA: hypothetical protein VMB91_09675 [Solirubrobacteraceae bacterium]|nr:hypothetical protein [Solirubrobacteraceae bacterium]
MGHLRALVALLAAGLACVALAATASAREGGEVHQFNSKKTAEVGVISSEQELSFDAIDIHCKGVKTTKTHVKTVFPTLTILVDVDFIKCSTATTKIGTKELPPSKVSFGGPIDIEYRAGGEPDATIVNTEVVPITFRNAMEGCRISLFETGIKKVASPATDQVTYTNAEVKAKNTKYFPEGVQHVVSIANSFSKIYYEVGGGPCEAIKRNEGKEGEYFGPLDAALKTGNLSWE